MAVRIKDEADNRILLGLQGTKVLQESLLRLEIRMRQQEEIRTRPELRPEELRLLLRLLEIKPKEAIRRPEIRLEVPHRLERLELEAVLRTLEEHQLQLRQEEPTPKLEELLLPQMLWLLL